MERRLAKLIAPPEPGWDIAFTRLATQVRPRLRACALEFGRLVALAGWSSAVDERHTPRGASTFLSVWGRTGLVLILDLTLVDAMAVDGRAQAWLDVRMLNPRGDVVVADPATLTPVVSGASAARRLLELVNAPPPAPGLARGHGHGRDLAWVAAAASRLDVAAIHERACAHFNLRLLEP